MRRAGEAVSRQKKSHPKFEDGFEYVFNNSPVGESITLPSGEIHVNAALCAMLGYNQEELQNRRWQDITHPDDVDLTQRAIDSLYSREKESVRFNKRYLHKNGTVIWADVCTSLRRAEGGQPLYFMTAVSDITARRQTQERLQESEERFRAVFNNTTIGLYRTTSDGRILMANPALLQMLGYSSFEQLAQDNLEDKNFEPAFPRSVFKSLMEDEGQVRGLVSAWKRSDGSTLYVRESARVVRDDSGGILFYEGSVEDITEAKLAEEEVRELAARQEALLAAIPEIVIEVDNRKVYIWSNKAGLDFFGEDVIGREAAYYFEGEEDTYAAVSPVSMGDENTIYVESWQRRKDGEKRLLAWWCRPLKDSQGDVIGALSSARDITERRRAEAALRESEQKYRSLVERAGDGILIIQAGVVKYVNPELARMWGRAPDGIMGRPFTDFVGPADLALVSERYRRRLAGEDVPRVYRATLARRDGSGVPTELNSEIIEYDGQPADFVIVRDLTERKKAEEERNTLLLRQEGVSLLQQSLLAPATLDQKLKRITDSIVRLFGADFCRIWLIRPGDLCERGCIHAEVQEGPHVCRYRDRCLHLLASSGRYTHLDGKGHRRVPFGCYKIGRVASDEDHRFITNDVQNDPRVHDHEWTRALGLVSFAGYQLRVPGGQTMGVLALFAQHPIMPSEDAMLGGFSSTIALVVRQAEGEEALRKSEEQYRALIETTGTGYVIVDNEGRVQDANSEYARLTGHGSLQDIQGRSVLDWTADYEKEKNVNAVKKCLENGYIRDLEIDYVDSAGHITPLEFNATVVDTGENRRILTLCRDITERKRAEDELRFKNLVLSTQQEASIDGILVVDENAMIVSFNQRFFKMWGIPTEFAEGRMDGPVLERMTSMLADPPSFLLRVRYLYEHQEETSREELLLKDGRVFDRYSAPMIGSDGRHYGRVWYFRDVTEHRRAEETLRDSEERFSTIFRASPVGTCITRLANGYLVDVNDAFLSLFGYSRDEVIGQTALELKMWANPEERDGLLGSLDRQGRVSDIELKIRRKSGEILDALISSELIMLGGERYMVSLLLDVTERRRAADRIKAALEEKEVLLREVHHRVKNNLQAMISLMDMRIAKERDGDVSRFLTELKEQARTMSLVYEQLYQSENLARVAMAPYLQKLVSNVLEAFGRGREIEIKLDIAPIFLEVTEAMPLGLIVNELMTNSLKHAFPARLERKPEVHVGLNLEETTCRLSVEDNGVGLPDGFDARAGRSLGLRLVRLWAVHQLGGELDVHGESGASFRITFTALKGRSS